MKNMRADVSGLRKNNMSNPFFIVRFRGGLGNQLFQYAAARIYGLQHSIDAKADVTGYKNPDKQVVPRGYKMDKFNTNLPVATEEEVRRYKYPFGILSKVWRGVKTKVFKLDYLDYHPQYFKKKIKYLDGYFQSPLYYKGHEDLIRSECTLREEYVSDTAKKIREDMKQTQSVSVHIRRGDLVTQIDAASAQGLCSLDYYEKAIETMNGMLSSPTQKPTYYVFSDDITWVEDHITFPENTVYVSKLNLQDYEELYLMSLSKHNIIGNSTFSWWSAWLNEHTDKIIMAPRQWTVRNTDHPTIIPKDWIRV
jgi:hypothetical protein